MIDGWMDGLVVMWTERQISWHILTIMCLALWWICYIHLFNINPHNDSIRYLHPFTLSLNLVLETFKQLIELKQRRPDWALCNHMSPMNLNLEVRAEIRSWKEQRPPRGRRCCCGQDMPSHPRHPRWIQGRVSSFKVQCAGPPWWPTGWEPACQYRGCCCWTWVQLLVWEDPTCHGTTKPVFPNSWALKINNYLI